MQGYESLIEDFELIVGDSSDVWMFTSLDVDTFDDDWKAYVAIVEDLDGATPVVLRPLPLNQELLNPDGTIKEKANKYFICQISPEESSRLQPDIKYFFIVQISNDTLGYKQELVQCRLKTKKQGIIR